MAAAAQAVTGVEQCTFWGKIAKVKTLTILQTSFRVTDPTFSLQ